MAKDDFLDNMDEVYEGADLHSAKKKEVKETGKKLEKVKVNISFPRDWKEKIKSFSGATVTGYIIEAVREKMTKDGIL